MISYFVNRLQAVTTKLLTVGQEAKMGSVPGFDRITVDPNIMSGHACIRSMRITVSPILNLIADGMSVEEIVEAYPYLEAEDVRQVFRYAAWLAEETIYALEPSSA